MDTYLSLRLPATTQECDGLWIDYLLWINKAFRVTHYGITCFINQIQYSDLYVGLIRPFPNISYSKICSKLQNP